MFRGAVCDKRSPFWDNPDVIDRIRRRLLLTWFVYAPFFAGLRVPAANAAMTKPLHALRAYLDTLIPEHLGPSATAIGVDSRLSKAGAVDARLQKLLIAGCGWLDAQAQRRGASTFTELTEADRIEVVQGAESASQSSGEWVFYQTTRAMAFEYYYSDPRSWRGIGFERAPQPAGHMDYVLPPTKLST